MPLRSRNFTKTIWRTFISAEPPRATWKRRKHPWKIGQARATAATEREAGEGGLEGRTGLRVETDKVGTPAGDAAEDFGEVSKVLGSRVVDRKTQYLIEWQDDHPDSWEPAENIAKDVVDDYETPWWQAARKADEGKLRELLEAGRNIDAIDENERTALHFAAGMGSEKCVRLLAEAGGNVYCQDRDGYTPLHIAAGYVHTTVVAALLELGADPDFEDKRGRSALQLAQQLLEKTPKNNPMQFSRRMALDQVVKLLDDAQFEEVEVSQIRGRREGGEGGATEYLVQWSDGSADTWEPAANVGDDLIRDYEEGLEYGTVEAVVDKRERGEEGEAGPEYLVKWSDSQEATWEPLLNLEPRVVAAFEGVAEEEVERQQDELEQRRRRKEGEGREPRGREAAPN